MAQMLGRPIGPIGYGMMGLSWRSNPVPTEQAIASMKAALDNGCNVWNGADFYGTPEYNSMTIIKAYFTKYPEDADKVILIMKGGGNPKTHRPDGSPENIRNSIDNMLAQIGGTKKVDVFSCGRRDESVPLETTFGVIQKEYIETGKIGAIGISETRAETVHLAAKLTKVAVAELELSLCTTDILHNDVAAACAEHDIPIIAYSPNGRGILAGSLKGDDDAAKMSPILAAFPRLRGEALKHNLKLAEQVAAVAKEKGCTPAQLAINWVRTMSNTPKVGTLIPLPGATTVARTTENCKVISLSDEERQRLTDMAENFEMAGERYPAGVPTNT